jgi:Phosphotransferase enzyme family
MDLHPDNVILTSDGPVVIDWRNATEDPPALDLAMTALILAQVSLSGDPFVADAAAEGMYAFRERVGRQILAGLPEAVARRSPEPSRISLAEVIAASSTIDGHDEARPAAGAMGTPSNRGWRMSGLLVGLVPVGHVCYEGRIMVVLQTLRHFGGGWRYVHYLIRGEDIAYAILDDVRSIEVFRHTAVLPIQ